MVQQVALTFTGNQHFIGKSALDQFVQGSVSKDIAIQNDLNLPIVLKN
jgi:hypothetical protein